MKNLIWSILVTCMMVVTLGYTVMAQEPDTTVITKAQNDIGSNIRWNNTAYVSISASVNETKVMAFVSVGADDPTMSCSGRLYLERYVNGRWSVVTSTKVNGTGTASASVSATGIKNNTYRARIYVKVGSDILTNTSRSTTYN